MTDSTPGSDVVFAGASLQDRIAWSRALAGAGNLVPAGFRDGNNANPAKILLAVETGGMLGLHPMAALNGIHVLDGKPTLSAALMSALVHRAGHKLRVSNKGSVDGEDYEVTATLIRKDDPEHPFHETWTIGRAKRAELWGRGNWKKYPETQMQWRAISGVARMATPEVLLGVWYTPDELGATVDADGDVIEDAEIVETEPEPNQAHNGKRGRANETQVRTASDGQDTPTTSGRPGRSRPQKAAAGPATRTQQAVADEWIDRIHQTDALPALYKLHDDAASRGVLDHEGHLGRTVESVFVTRRGELQAKPAQTVVDATDIEPAF